MHKVFLVEGRTASGKSTIVRKVCEITHLSTLRSYTTREMRPGETEETSDHIHILPERVSNYKDKMVAYTERVGYVSFATLPQLYANTFYIINPSGERDLRNNVQRADIQFITVYVDAGDCREKRAEERGDIDSWKANDTLEDTEFSQYERSGEADYVIRNNGSIDSAVNQMLSILRLEGVYRG